MDTSVPEQLVTQAMAGKLRDVERLLGVLPAEERLPLWAACQWLSLRLAAIMISAAERLPAAMGGEEGAP
jgi:hypothetical protein